MWEISRIAYCNFMLSHMLFDLDRPLLDGSYRLFRIGSFREAKEGRDTDPSRRNPPALGAELPWTFRPMIRGLKKIES